MKKIGLLFVFLVLIHGVIAAHYISGWTEDALDGESSNGKSVVLWNHAVGISDNLTDIVGVTGNSGVSGVYMIDCELLNAGCNVNDVLNLMIFGEKYISWIINVTVSGFGYDAIENLSLNSPPNVELVYPRDSGFVAGNIDFNCSFFDYDDNIASVALWGNWSGSWAEEGSVTSGLEDGYVIFNRDIVQGNYEWNCFIEDDLGIGSFNESNNSFFVDTTAPEVWGVTSVSQVCGFGSVPVDCSVSDNVGVGSVWVQSISPSGNFTNYSAGFVSGNVYRANIDLNESGDWDFECFANDSVGNFNFSFGETVSVGSLNAEISFNGGVVFSGSPSIEGEVLNVSVNVTNDGCIGSGNFVVGFFDDEVSFENKTVFIGVDSYKEVVAEWTVDIGDSDIFVYADLDNVLNEDNESNNVVNGSAYLGAWQGIYGNTSLDRVLRSGKKDVGLWVEKDGFNGNVFVADSESNIEWNDLQAIDRDKSGFLSSGDFGEIDIGLGMTSLNDSVSAMFASSDVENFTVFGSDIENVSYINSSSNGNFVTGILWDTGDSLDSEYDSIESEDIVFVTKVNRGVVGSYGIYDYEINIPSKLRDYNNADGSTVYLYYDLN